MRTSRRTTPAPAEKPKGRVVRPPTTTATPTRRPAPPVEEDDDDMVIVDDADGEEEVDDDAAEAAMVGDDIDDADPDAGYVGIGEEDEDDEVGDSVIDLSDVDEKAAFAPIAPGVYHAQILDGEYGRSQRSGNPMITWQISALINPEEGRTRTLYYHTVLNADNLPRLKRMIVRIDPEFDMSRIVPRELGEQLAGYACKVRIKNRRYEGEMRPNISDVLPPDEDTADFFEE